MPVVWCKMTSAGLVFAEAGFAVDVKTDCLHVQVFFFFKNG